MNRKSSGPRFTPAFVLFTVVLAGVACTAPSWTVDTTASPTAAPEPAVPAFAAVVGPEEIVFDWTVDRCMTTDVPDLSARAFVDGTGQVQLIASHDHAQRSVGPDLNNVVHQCDVILESDIDPDPAHFNDHEWISATYTEDGQTIHALIHNEYQGHTHPGQCPQGEYFPCWYNTITHATSTDGGASYEHSPAPGHLVAALPYPFEAGAGPYGVMAGSNIVKGDDGYFYTLVRIDAYASADQHVCLMRTNDLSQPGSWRAWDGDGFDMPFLNPYADPPSSPEQHICPPISYDQIGNMHESLAYNTFLGKYVLVGTTGQNIDNRLTWGFFYAFSDDLIHWTDRQLLAEMPLGGVEGLNGPDVFAYPSLIDPDSESRNFETAGKRAYVYYTHLRIKSGAGFWDRDLVRFPVEFFTTEEEARSADARTVLSMDATVDGDMVRVSGDLATAGNMPVSGAPVELEATPQEGPGMPGEYTITGIVPEGAREASGAVRINSECNCTGTSDVSIYELSYTVGNGTGLVQRRDFAAGLGNSSVWGSGDVGVVPSDQGAGNMLHFSVAPHQDARFNATHFAVAPGSSYTFTVKARVAPSSEGSGYFALIFLGSNNEVERVTIPLTPQHVVLGSTTTGPDGSFEFATDELGSMAVSVEVRFPGDDRLWPSAGEDRVP